jgi:hypothetical protein
MKSEMWYKTPIFRMFIRDTIAILVGLALLRIARPILELNPDIQQIFDLVYLDIRSETLNQYKDTINAVLKYISFYSVPFFFAGFVSGLLGKREGGILLGVLPPFFYSLIFIFLVPAIHASNAASGNATNWLEWALLDPMVHMISGIIGGVIAWRLRFKITDLRSKLKTTL